MIDTTMKIIPYNQATITNFDRFGGKDAVHSVVNGFVPRNGKGSEIYVIPNKEDKQIGYFPKITLSKCAFSVTDSFVNFKIECSLPKILFNNNVYELSENDFEPLLQALQNKLNRLGLFVEIDVLRNAYVSRIDYSKNVIIPHNCSLFLNWFNKVDFDSRLGKTTKEYDTGGTSFKFFTKRYHVLFYDKTAEVKKSLYCENRSVSKEDYCQSALNTRLIENKIKIFRLEACFKRDKLKKIAGKLGFSIGKMKLSDLFKAQNSKLILQYYSDIVFSSLRTLNLDLVNEITLLERIKDVSADSTDGKILKLLSQVKLATQYGISFFRNYFNYDSAQISRLKKSLEEINSPNNSSFSSVMQNIHAVESCLQEFLPLEESDFLTCENG